MERDNVKAGVTEARERVWDAFHVLRPSSGMRAALDAFEAACRQDERERSRTDAAGETEQWLTICGRLADAEAALNTIASWREGPVVLAAFDEPHSAEVARAYFGRSAVPAHGEPG